MDRNSTLNSLLEVLKINKHKNAREFYLRCKAQYEAFVNNEEQASLNYINKACEEFNNPLIIVDKYTICAKFKNLEEMKKIINDFDKNYNTKRIYNYNTLIKFKVILLNIEGKGEEIPELIKELKYYPQSAKNKLLSKHIGTFEEIAITE